jgi:deoxyribodipyrimidine photo-lyase
MPLSTPPAGRPEVVEWVDANLADLSNDDAVASPAFVGGQTEADAALAAFDVAGYAARRNEVWPPERRGASKLSPYIRHGLLTLGRVWETVSGPGRDVRKFRDELLWQEYARHVYARVGGATGKPLRFAPRHVGSGEWPADMACVDGARSELETDGWIVNQQRMWLASHWSVRTNGDWRAGEDHFFAHLLDGSRAANRLGWQWTSGLATGRTYGFSRQQVRRSAPGLCDTCSLRTDCPIEEWPPDDQLVAVDPPEGLRTDPDPAATAGPAETVVTGVPDVVWITAESMGDDDPALRAHPELPVVFVFDVPLLRRVSVSSKRLVFLAETIADLAARRPVEVHRGDPVDILAGRSPAVTFAPVPGWRRRSGSIRPAEVHPWPWLAPPHAGKATSFSAWRNTIQSRA